MNSTQYPKIIKQIYSNFDNLTYSDGSYIDKQACISKATKILPGSVIMGNVDIGENNIIGPYAIIGTAPQHRDYYEGKIKRKARVIIGDRNIIREFTTIHSPIERTTSIGNDCFLMAYSHVSHDTILEDKVTLTNNTQIAGHSYLMDGVTIGLNTNIHQYSTIGAYSMIGMGSIITKDIPPFLTYKNFKCYKINKVGLERNDFTEGEIQKINAFYNQKEIDFKCFLENNERLLHIFNRFFKVRNPNRNIYEYEND